MIPCIDTFANGSQAKENGGRILLSRPQRVAFFQEASSFQGQGVLMTNKTAENPKTARNPQNESERNDSRSHTGSSQHDPRQQKTHDPLKDRRPNENENEQDEPTDRQKAS